ncbi:hypothetical protein ACJMK2_013909 [Sinanodonta woodiana]|uniref:D-serine dehydratase n=1 Tax=Sinanodonta woodiana TaxID=1069815 RepID=A0ABD3V1F8_SINWO
MENKLPETIYDVHTPCLLVDLDRVKANCQRMIDRCMTLGVELRPHMKTHKTIEGAILMTGGNKRKISVSTLAEAEFYADNGFDDILFAHPFITQRLDRCVALANRLEAFHVMIDSSYAIESLTQNPLSSGKKWSVLLEVDCGYGRSGVPWNDDEAVKLVKMAASSSSIIFQGLYTHCGDSYTSCTQDDVKLQQVQDTTTKRLLDLKDRIRREGIECKTVGCGSTPSCSKPRKDMSALTEFHPGNYIFYDVMQMTIGSCAMEDIAVKIATSVVSHKASLNMLLTDSGFASLGADGANYINSQPSGFTVFPAHPELKLIGMSQELGKVQAIDGKLDLDKYPHGTRLFIHPWHSCDAAMMHPYFYVHSGEQIVGIWKPVRGW